MLHTRLCELLGIECPIMVAPMGPKCECAGLVYEIKPAAEVVRELVEGVQRIIEGRLNQAVANK